MDKTLIVLVGPQGAGKTTYCREHLPGCFRVSQDEQGQRAHFAVFQEAVLRGEPCIVIDRINAQKYQRLRYLDFAKQHGYRTRMVWLNVDRAEALRRIKERGEHPTLSPEEAEKAISNYFHSFQTPLPCEADELEIIGPPATPVEAVRRREEYVGRGLLRGDRSDDGTLAVYTYTDECTYSNAWDDITRNSRGHIFDLRTGECVARPFPKFFNLGENQETLPENFPWDQPYEIMEKMDGWLGVLYRHEGKFKVATRGSFHSSGAVWATEMVQRLDFSCLPDEATLCFEIIGPEQRIILDYGDQRNLVVLAAFDRFTGTEYPRRQVEEWAHAIGLPVVPLLAHMSLEEMLHKQKELQKVEGFVIRFTDGRRVKVKTAWYLALSRELSKLSPITVWESLRGGKVPREYLASVAEELRPLAEKYAAVLEGQYARLLLYVEEQARAILSRHGDDRAALGRYAQEHKAELGIVRPALFLLLDGKADKLDRMVKELIYPKGNQFVPETELFGR